MQPISTSILKDLHRMQIKCIFFNKQQTEQPAYFSPLFNVPMTQRNSLLSTIGMNFTAVEAIYKRYRHFCISSNRILLHISPGRSCCCWWGWPTAADEAAAVSSLPAVAAEGLDAAVEAAEWAPDPVKSKAHFQVSVALKEVFKDVYEHNHDFKGIGWMENWNWNIYTVTYNTDN